MEQDTNSGTNQTSPQTQPLSSVQPPGQKQANQSAKVNSQEPPSPPKNKKSEKVLILGFVILLIVVGLGAGAFLYFKGQPPTPTQTEESTQIEQETAPDVETYYKTKGSEITSGWETHTANTYQVKYPSDIQVNEQTGGRLILTKSGPTQKTETEFYDGFSLSFQSFNLSNTSLENYVQNKIKESEEVGVFEVVSDPSPTNIGNYTGITYTLQGIRAFRNIYLQSSDSTMLVEIIDSTNDPSNLGFEETVNQILSTFQFTN